MLGGDVLEKVKSYKYLGITITDDLKWDTHISNICSKARRMTGLIYRNLYYYSDSAFLLVLYKTMIRPLLEYCDVIWDPHQKFLRDRLRSVEKLALRMCLKSWRLFYDELIAKAEITPLESRRIHNKLLLMYKVLCYFLMVFLLPALLEDPFD